MLGRYDDDHEVYQSSVAFASYTAPDLPVAYARCDGLCAFGDNVVLDAGLVAVEGRDMKHVAVCADPDGFHLAVPGQRSRMGGAARAKDLSTASTVMLPADDSEGSFAGNAGVAGFIGDPVWWVFKLAFPGLGGQFR